MKNLLISLCSLVLMISIWLVFAHYSEGQIDSLTETIRQEIIPVVESSDWDSSNQKMDSLNKSWHEYKRLAIFFLDTDVINEIDYSLAKSMKYVKAEDISNSSGELNAMVEQLSFLYRNDELNWANIF